MQEWRTHMQAFQQGRGTSMVFGLVWFVINEKQGKLMSLTYYRIIMDMHNVANQKALQEWPQNTWQHRFSWEAILCSNEELLSSVKLRSWATLTNSCHLTHISCLPAYTDENYGETSWQEQNRAYANQTHILASVATTSCLLGTTAWYRGFESKIGCEQRINPI